MTTSKPIPGRPSPTVAPSSGCTTVTPSSTRTSGSGPRRIRRSSTISAPRNTFTERRTAHLRGLTDAIFGEIKARTQETDLSVPSYRSHGAGPDGDEQAFWYYVRTQEGAEYAIYCRAPAIPGDRTPPEIGGDITGEEVLFGRQTSEAVGTDFFSIGAFSVSPNGSLLAYSTDTSGAERFTLRVKDLSHRRNCCRTPSRTPRTGWPGPATTTSSTAGRTSPGGRTSCSGTRSAPIRTPTRRCSPSPTSGSGSASTPAGTDAGWSSAAPARSPPRCGC